VVQDKKGPPLPTYDPNVIQKLLDDLDDVHAQIRGILGKERFTKTPVITAPLASMGVVGSLLPR
jgi:hypothetical protein